MWTQRPGGLYEEGAPTESWDRERRGEEPSLPSLSCFAELPLAWGLAEVPDWEAGPREGEACPSSQGATGWLLQILGVMTPGASGDSSSLAVPRWPFQLGVG